MKFPFFNILSLAILVIVTSFSYGQQRGNKNGNPPDRNKDNKPESVFYTSVPYHDYDVILGRPTSSSITLSILSYKTIEAYISYGKVNQNQLKSEVFKLKENEPFEFILNKLELNTEYCYNLFFKQNGDKEFVKSNKYFFHTQRKNIDNYQFTITADPHLDQNTDTLIYKKTFLNISDDSADFHVDLGDIFMTDKYRNNYKESLKQYLAQRYYLGLVCNSSPLFLVLGNHDGESGQRLNGSEDNMSIWSNITRKKFFPNPFPDEFYSGDNNKDAFAGLLQDYYSWEWGNSLYIVLDPFWYTPRAGSDDPWERTLGKEQYDWLKKTLEKSKAKFKFVFTHNLVGGRDIKGKARGGSEVVGFYEWGGMNADSTNGFKDHRKGWEMPIHNLLVKYKVSAVFHGHDHLFAKQEKDGIIYQCIPQPGAKGVGNVRNGEECGYVNGIILNGPGYIRVSVSEKDAKIEYVGTSINSENKKNMYSYEIKEN